MGEVLSDEAEEYARLKFSRWQWSQQRGAAEAEDVKFAVEQRTGGCSDVTARVAQLARGPRRVVWL